MASRNLSIVQATDADVLVFVGPGYYNGVNLIGAAAGTVKVYDHEAVAGVATSDLVGGCGVTAANASASDIPLEPVRVTKGLVVVVTGAGNLAQVRYSKGAK